MQISSFEASRIKHWKIQALKDLQYLVKEINMFIEVGKTCNLVIACFFSSGSLVVIEPPPPSLCQATEAVTSICTLYELGQSLAGLKDKKRYEELNLGPLCKLPLVHRMFKIDGNTKDDDIHQIETADILKVLLKWPVTGI